MTAQLKPLAARPSALAALVLGCTLGAALSGCDNAETALRAPARAPAPEARKEAPPQATLSKLNEQVAQLEGKPVVMGPNAPAVPIERATSAKLTQMLAQDKDGSGGLSAAEFSAAMGGLQETVLKKALARIDRDGNAELSALELTQYIERGARAVDANRNGAIDAQDVQALKTRPPKQASSPAPTQTPSTEAGVRSPR